MRRLTTRLLWCVLLAAAASTDAAAQDRAFLRVETNYPDALVYADSVLLGRVGTEAVPVSPATRSIRLTPPEAGSWTIAPVERPVAFEAGDTVSVTANFPYYYRIESVPFGADVLIEDDLGRRKLGETPLLYRAEDPLAGNLVVQRNGYAVERLRPGSEIWNRHVANLSPSDDLDPSAAKVSWHPPRRHRAWIDYVALGTAAAAGVLAVHYKFRADDLYERYRDTEDPALRDRVHSNDVRAGVALGTMQVGLGVFAVRLILR